jgi:hypothetical protein
MKLANDWISEINKLLVPFVGKYIPSFDVSQIYCWPPNGHWRCHSNPIDESYKLSSLNELQEIRFVTLLLIPRMNSEIDAPELLCKKHLSYGYIFPSLLPHQRNFTSPEDIGFEVGGRAHEVITRGKIEQVDYAGGLMTFRKSPTKQMDSFCYIFPLYVLTTSLARQDLDTFHMAGYEFAFLSKFEVEAMDPRRPVADVYRAVEELFSSWGYFRAYAPKGKTSSESELSLEEFRSTVDNIGIPSDVYQQLMRVLLNCGPFDDDRSLRAFFVDSRISAWRASVPGASSPVKRAKGLIAFLHDKHNADQQNALILFLSVLRDNVPPNNLCHQELVHQIENLKGVFFSQGS